MARGLELIGNPLAGRPTLGDKVPVALFRALRMVGMMECLDSMIGDASTLIYTSGRGVGKNLGDSIVAKTGRQVDRYLGEVVQSVRSLGIGLMSATKVQIDEGLIEVRVDECITCSGAPVINKRVCHFEAGLIAGVLEVILGKTVNVVETRCNCMGEKGCVFEAKF